MRRSECLLVLLDETHLGRPLLNVFLFWVDGRGDYSRDKGEDAGKSKMRVERCPPQASSAEALHFAGLFVVHPCAKASVVCGAKARMHGQRM